MLVVSPYQDTSKITSDASLMYKGRLSYRLSREVKDLSIDIPTMVNVLFEIAVVIESSFRFFPYIIIELGCHGSLQFYLPGCNIPFAFSMIQHYEFTEEFRFKLSGTTLSLYGEVKDSNILSN